jgi:NADPH-dependent glutamate synthase beta subunit-like oxidoreductase
VRVVAQGGDGGTTDIGFGCLSGMFERNDDVLYICYDNGGYMNTGVQRSSATPPAARTATTMPLGPEPGNPFGQGKFVPAIAMAHEIPYVATATVADLRDLENKVTKAMGMRGARYIHILVPCPLGWGTASHDTIRMARLAKETGIFPVFEAEHGEVKSALAIRRPLPVEEYLRPQKRFAHLFGKTPAVEHDRPHPGASRQEHPPLRPAGQGGRVMDKPFAITLNPGSSLANHTGSWRTARPVYLDRLPPCNNQCPAGEDIQGWLFHAESGNYEAAWRHLTRDNPFAAIMGRVCYHTCESACNRGKIDEAVGINSVERFLGDEAIKRGWKFAAPAKESGKQVLIVGAGPSGMSAAYHLRKLGHAVTVMDAGPYMGGMMRFGIPKYRLPREVLDAEMQRIVDMGVTVKLNSKVDNILDTMKSRRFDAAFLAVGAHIGKRAMIPSGDAAKIVDAISVLRSMEGEDKPMLGRRVVVYGGGNTAIDVARSVKRMGAEPIIVYRRTRDKAPAHDFEIEEALQEGVMVKWLSTIKQAGDHQITIEKMALDDKGFPQPTGEFETLEADSVVLALGQDVDLGLLNGVPGLEVTGRRGQGRHRHDDRPPRHLRRRRHGAGRAQRHRRRRPATTVSYSP